MTKTLDLATLDLQDALDLAILVEDEAKERYDELAAQMEAHHTADAATFFHFMSANEARHGAELAARRRQLFGDAPRRVNPSMVWEIEAPEYEKVHAFMTLHEALTVAMAAEVKAHWFFTDALKLPVADPVKKLFLELQEEEVHHQELVGKELAKLPPDEAAPPEEFADEGVSQ
jgi:rubrerythrin